ncbi:MAG: hypothetical protein WBB88_00280, partial [Methyloceanibacter sp.]
MNIGDAAIGDHAQGEEEVETDADVPADEEARHPAQFAHIEGQNGGDAKAGKDRQKEPRPHQNDADRLRPALEGRRGRMRHVRIGSRV